MDEQSLINRLFQVAAYGLTHKHHSHTVAKHKLYMQLVAGVGIDALLKRYVKREDEALFAQRVALTQHITTAISENLLDVFYKVPRSNAARRVLTFNEKNPDKKTQEVEGILSKFWGSSSWEAFLATRFIELNATDPNAFVVFEWDNFDGNTEFIQPRPYEVSSINAVDFQYKNRVLQYLVAKETIRLDTTIQELEGANEKLKNPTLDKINGVKYTLYGKDQTWQLVQVDERRADLNAGLVEGVLTTSQGADGPEQHIKLGGKCFRFLTFEKHNAGSVPAFRVGYLRDHATQGETYVNPMHKAESFILKTIKTNSEFDLVATLLAFPQMIKYGSVCSNKACYGGELQDGTSCGECGGTGIKSTAPSAQDALVFPMPKSKEEMIPLNDILKYLNPPVEIVKWQENYIDSLAEKAKRFMFNSDTFGPDKTAKTATGTNLDMQNVYDTLHPFAVKYSEVWEFGVRTVATLADRGENLIASYYFGKDFKLKSLDTLIQDAQHANAIGNPSLVRNINEDIARIIYAERPLEYLRFELKELYNPFAGKSEVEILFLMSGNLIPQADKILHANYSKIFDELEFEYAASGKDFYKLNRKDQRAAIYKKVEDIKAEIEKETPEPFIELGD